MFYKNSNMYKSKMKFKDYTPISFDKGIDFLNNNSEFGACKETYNFDYNDGCLKDSFGIEEFKTTEKLSLIGEHTYSNCMFPEDVMIARYFFKRLLHVGLGEFWSIVYMFDMESKFYYYIINRPDKGVVNIPSLEMENCFSVKNFSTFINGQETIIFYDDNKCKIYVWVPNSDQPATVSSFMPNIADMCFCNNRTFFVSDNPANTSVMYSEEFNGLNFNISNKEMGCVKLKDNLGNCKRIINFNDEVFVFRDRGIVKIYQSRDKLNFDAENIYSSDNLIFGDTVCICGNEILFLTTDGLYEFDGNNVKKLDFEWTKIFNKKRQFFAKSCFYNGVYYLACDLEYNDDKKILGENYNGKYMHTVIKYDINTKKTVVCRGLSIVDFVPIIDSNNSAMGVLYIDSQQKNQIGMLNESGIVKNDTLLKKWTSKQYDFGDSDNYKFIKSMKLTTHADITLNLYIDNKIKTIDIKGKNTMQTIKINEKANFFGYGFETSAGGNYIANIEFSVGSL